MDRIWQIIPHDSELVERLEKVANVSPVIAQLLAARGITDGADIKTFLAASMNAMHDPDALPNMKVGAQTIIDAIRDKQKMLIPTSTLPEHEFDEVGRAFHIGDTKITVGDTIRAVVTAAKYSNGKFSCVGALA